ncbi:MAG: hypothetical protein K2Y56_15975 [Methylobacterium sp.]|uniref:hypothetical protein n=1 Tax=Methylobacterium sp. TaxID=409 RepID=UPI0025CEFA41|nr:hypothetical protein [Methylobacterium sp.]MBX9933012.1 hypothetical protein [Methylobacterium sp.]
MLREGYLRAGQAATLTAVSIFLVALRSAFAPGEKPSTRQFFLGAVLLVMGNSGGAIWRSLWRMGGEEDLDRMLTNDVSGHPIWMQIEGGFLMISGPAAAASNGAVGSP